MWPLLIFTFVIFAVPITAQQVIEHKEEAKAESCMRDSKTLKDQQECKRQAAARFVQQNHDLAFPQPYIPILDPSDFKTGR